MQILQNMLLEWRPAIGEDEPALPLVERVLDFDLDTGEIILINIFNEKAFPILRSYRDIEQSYKGGNVAILEKDPFANLMVRDEELTDAQRQHRDAAWETMAPLLEKKTWSTCSFLPNEVRSLQSTSETLLDQILMAPSQN